MHTKITSEVTECMDSLLQQTRNQQSRAVDIFSDMYVKLEDRHPSSGRSDVRYVHHGAQTGRCADPEMQREHPKGETFPVVGAEELQVLAETYNKVYEENQEAQMLIRHKAEHDPLTDLLNRGSFEKLLRIYEEGDSPFALIMVDVDYFKTVNDTCGHAAGDDTLKKIASLLTTTFRSSDYVCRIGGDEFAVIMVEMTSDLRYTIQEKIDAANEALQQADDGLPKVSLCVGVAFSDRENPTGTIFEDADRALYQRKAHGKAGCDFYENPSGGGKV